MLPSIILCASHRFKKLCVTVFYKGKAANLVTRQRIDDKMHTSDGKMKGPYRIKVIAQQLVMSS